MFWPCDGYSSRASSGALNLFPLSTPSHTTIDPNPPVSWQSRGFHMVASQQRKIRQNPRVVFNRHLFSSSIGYKKNRNTWKLNCHPSTRGIFPWTPGVREPQVKGRLCQLAALHLGARLITQKSIASGGPTENALWQVLGYVIMNSWFQSLPDAASTP